MKILALGATGVIGSQLLVCHGMREHEIHVTTRRDRAQTDRIRYIRGDAHDPAFLQGLLRQDWDVIVDFMLYDTAGFRSRIDSLLGATGQYILTSSARVFADSPSPITEGSPRLLDVLQDAVFLATDEYALTKARQEDFLRASGRRNWTIIRPYITFGEGRLQLGPLEKESWLYRALRGRSIVFCKPLLNKQTTMTDAADVAAMLAALIGSPDANGEDFNLAGGPTVTWGEVLSAYLDVLDEHLGKRPAVILQDLESFCQAAGSVPQIIYDRMYHRRFDSTKIGQFFDTSGLSGCLPTLQRRLHAQISGGGLPQPDWWAEVLRDRVAGEHAALSEIAGVKSRLRYLLYRHFSPAMISKMRSR